MKTPPITALTSVNEIVRRLPASLAVFTRHGIDACCGGALSLKDAAQRHRLDEADLLEELGQVAAETNGG